MEFVTLLWSFSAALAVTLGAVCGLLWLIERRDFASLMLCSLGLAIGAAAYVEIGMMHSATADEYGEWVRWYQVPGFAALTSQLLFVHYYLGTGRLWLLWSFICARSVILVVDFVVHPNVNFSNIASIRSVTVLGERVSMIEMATPRSEWQWLAIASLFLFIAYIGDAAARRWLKGDNDSRRKALTVGLGLAAPMLWTLTYTQLMVFGFLQVPTTNIPWFLGALLVMAFQLGRDVFLSGSDRLELSELRNKVAHVDRVTVMGQLATTLAHELTQPLAATAANLEAVRAQLKREKPDLEELNAIVDDIERDDRRAAAIINRMRDLFKRRAIAMQELRVEDVVHDAVSLVRSEATAQRIALRSFIEPGLPSVLGDRMHLTQVLLNLLINSIQAVQSRPSDARWIEIEAHTDAEKSEIEITIRDSGPGIPERIYNDIFKPFFSTKPEGMGVGLALSRTIVEAHGGRLWADRMTQQDGAVFRFTLRRIAERQPASSPIGKPIHSEAIRTTPKSA